MGLSINITQISVAVATCVVDSEAVDVLQIDTDTGLLKTAPYITRLVGQKSGPVTVV